MGPCMYRPHKFPGRYVPWTLRPLTKCDRLWFWKGEGTSSMDVGSWGKVSVLASRRQNGKDSLPFFLSENLFHCQSVSSYFFLYLFICPFLCLHICVVSVWCLNVVCMSFDFWFSALFLLSIVSSFASFFVRLLNIIYVLCEFSRRKYCKPPKPLYCQIKKER